MENKIKLNITLSDGKIIFKALSEMPFKLVYELIGKINQQVNQQKTGNDNSEIILYLNELELQTILEALSEEPFNKVHGVIEKIGKIKAINQ